MRIGSASGIAGHGDFSLILPVPDGETLGYEKVDRLYLNKKYHRKIYTNTILRLDDLFLTFNIKIFNGL